MHTSIAGNIIRKDLKPSIVGGIEGKCHFTTCEYFQSYLSVRVYVCNALTFENLDLKNLFIFSHI